MDALKGKVALVTGASLGFGAAIARRFAMEGAAVVVNYPICKSEADKVVSDITAAGGRAIALQADVTNQDEVRAMIEATFGTLGPLDILVNNAGAYEFVPLGEITVEHFHRLFNLNVLGMILVTQAALPFMQKAGAASSISVQL